MKLVKHLLPIFTGIFLLMACQKEFSVDTGILPGVQAVGTLKDTLGDCQPIVINGSYYADSTLKDSNYVTVEVNVISAGAYNIYSDTVSGFSFRDSGYFATPGVKTVKLKGRGRPIAAGPEDFIVTFGNSFCFFSIQVLPGVPGGGGPNPQPVISDYFPTTTNSFWSYTLDVTGDTLRYIVQPADVTISGQTYRPFMVSGGGSNDSLFFRKASGVYYQFGDIDFIGALDSVFQYVDYPFLKDNVPVNNTWESGLIDAYAKNSYGKAKAQFTILAKDVQQTINGVTVDSVIKVQRSIMFQSTGTTTFQNLGSFNFYFAKNKGLLLIDGNLPASISPIPIPFKLEAKNYRVF